MNPKNEMVSSSSKIIEFKKNSSFNNYRGSYTSNNNKNNNKYFNNKSPQYQLPISYNSLISNKIEHKKIFHVPNPESEYFSKQESKQQNISYNLNSVEIFKM